MKNVEESLKKIFLDSDPYVDDLYRI